MVTTDATLKKDRIANMVDGKYSFFGANPYLFGRDMMMEPAYTQYTSAFRPGAPVTPVVIDCHACNQGILSKYTLNSAGTDFSVSNVWALNDFDQTALQRLDFDLFRAACSYGVIARVSGSINKDTELPGVTDKLFTAYQKELGVVAAGYKAAPATYAFPMCGEAAVPTTAPFSSCTAGDRAGLLGNYCNSQYTAFVEVSGKLTKTSIPSSGQLYADVKAAFATYAAKTAKVSVDLAAAAPLDIAEKLGSGGSSYGSKRYWVLAKPASSTGKPRIIEFKELVPIHEVGDASVADGDPAYVQKVLPSGATSANGTLVDTLVANAKSMGAYTWTPHYAFTTIGGKPFMVREKDAVADSWDTSDSTSKTSKYYIANWNAGDAANVASYQGKFLARAHASAVFKKGGASALAAAAAWIAPGSGDAASKSALAALALAYGQQNTDDLAAVKAAYTNTYQTSFGSVTTVTNTA